MHWWQSAFTSASSSSPSSARSNPEDTFANGTSSRKSDAASRFSRRGFSFCSHQQRRRFTRPRKLRHLTNNDVGFFYSARSSSSSSGSPLPLPLPELETRRDSHSDAKYVPLPSPKERPKKTGEERETTDIGGARASWSMLASPDCLGTTGRTESKLSQKSTQERNGSVRMKNKYNLNLPVSAPTSPFSSPVVSPQRRSCANPPVFEVWSAPEVHPTDASPEMNPSGFGFATTVSAEKNMFGVTGSTLHSPKLSPHPSNRSPQRQSSPLHKIISTETSTVRIESNSQAVHPLPLPPGAALSPLPTPPPPQVAAKSKLTTGKSQWQKGKLIGRGTFGSVYVASNRETGALCAMKEVELLPEDPKSEECIKQIEQEIKVLSCLKHPNIVQYYGSEIVGDRFYIYLEYVHPGSINKYLLDHCGAITESIVRNFTRHILSGLAYLHSTKTIHRDIKGANLLVDANGVVKLADFGMAKHLTGQDGNLSLKGSPYWMAPELMQCEMQKDSNPDLALAIDIWSLGCTIIEMMNGKPPWSEYEGPAAMFRVMTETPQIPETLSPEGKDFLHCCFRRNPAERPSASVLLEHRFLKNSHQPDVSPRTLLFNRMAFTDKAHSQREHSSYKRDKFSMSTDTTLTKGKVANNSSFTSDSFRGRLANELVVKLPN